MSTSAARGEHVATPSAFLFKPLSPKGQMMEQVKAFNYQGIHIGYLLSSPQNADSVQELAAQPVSGEIYSRSS